MSPVFADEEFQLAWKELDEPQLDGGWELFTETMGVKIYRLFDQVQQPQQQPQQRGVPLMESVSTDLLSFSRCSSVNDEWLLMN